MYICDTNLIQKQSDYITLILWNLDYVTDCIVMK